MKLQGYNDNGEELRSFYVEPSVRTGCDPGGPSATRQEFADECDINVLMAKYEATGIMPPVNGRTPMFGDVSAVPDLRLALEQIEQATESFMSLPAVVRKEFDNDVVRFVEYASDPSNVDQMRKWGLATMPPPPAAPVRVEVVTPEPAPAPAPGSASP